MTTRKKTTAKPAAKPAAQTGESPTKEQLNAADIAGLDLDMGKDAAPAPAAPAPAEKPKKASAKEVLFIRSKGDRFRRCGQEFNKNGEAFASDRFNEEQLEVLGLEPQLICEYKKAEKAAE